MKISEILFAAIIYICFFGLIAFAVWYTHSAYCLWALLLLPSLKAKKDGENGDLINIEFKNKKS